MNATIASDAALERSPAVPPMPSSVPDVSSAGVTASTGAFVALLQMLVGSKGSMIDAAIDALPKANPVTPPDDDEHANGRAAILTSFVQISAYMPPRTAMVPPADTRLTARWMLASGAARVPALLSLPPGAT